MRPSALALVVALAVPAAAQSQFAPGAGAFVSLDALDPLRLGDGAVEVGVGAGWRFGNGLDAGVRVGAEHTLFDAELEPTVTEARRLALGVEAGYTTRLGARAGLRLGVWGGLQQTVETGALVYVLIADRRAFTSERRAIDVNTGGVGASAATFRRVPVGRVILQPTVGVFVDWNTSSRADAGRPFTLRADAGLDINEQPSADGGGGVSVGLPILFAAAGADLVLDLRGAYDLARNSPDVGVRLRVNL